MKILISILLLSVSVLSVFATVEDDQDLIGRYIEDIRNEPVPTSAIDAFNNLPSAQRNGRTLPNFGPFGDPITF